jgi:XTP/dITP diphosphohydrolase
MELVFCTNNDHKISEVTQIMGSGFTFLKLKDIHFLEEIPEPFHTLEENSITKAKTVFDRTGKNTFAEDTGLFIPSLGGEPGVFSARYAGDDGNSERNMEKVLSKLENQTDRRAYFKTVALQKSGNKGFGYDPIFIPDGSELTFADLSADEKHAVSHRRKAFDSFADYLKHLPS